jgi:mono/diheme cytochrome c family protein
MQKTIMGTFLALGLSAGFGQTGANLIYAPRFWNERDLSDWATPVAGLNVRPGHYSEKEYHAAAVAESVRTYPVYFPGHEPAGYWDMLRNAKPIPLITPGARTLPEWIKLGERVFREMDLPLLRSYDPKLVEVLRSEDKFKKLGGHPQKDGTVFGLRWVPTATGLALGVAECAACHSRSMPDGAILEGAPFNDPGDGVVRTIVGAPSVPEKLYAPGETFGMALWREFATPWVPNDVHESLKTMTADERPSFRIPIGVIPRFNGSPFYPTKVLDLIGLRERKYLDHTATHRMRGAEDLMRYVALITCCDIADFGPHRMLTDEARRIRFRFADETLFALAQYVLSLEPPRNPNLGNPRSTAGRRVFDREGCGGCHAPPSYTNNKLTLAAGFTPQQDHPLHADILPISVGTDPNLALKTRKGTGLYKVPSLRGVWYRGLFDHDGSITSLEEWFDPARLLDDFEPSGFKGYKVMHRAVPGHEYGLNLSSEDKAALIAFLKTL